MTPESNIDPPPNAATGTEEPSAPESVPTAELFARKGPNKGLLLAVAFGLALLVAAGALLVGLNKL